MLLTNIVPLAMLFNAVLCYQNSLFQCSYTFHKINVKLSKNWDDTAELTFFKCSDYVTDLKGCFDQPFKCWANKDDASNITCQGIQYSGIFNPDNDSDSFKFVSFKDGDEYTHAIKEGFEGFWCVNAEYDDFLKTPSSVEFTTDGSNGKSFVSNYQVLLLLISAIPMLVIALVSHFYLNLDSKLTLLMGVSFGLAVLDIIELSLDYFEYTSWCIFYRWVIGFSRQVAEIFAILVVLDQFRDVENSTALFLAALFVKCTLMGELQVLRALQSPLSTLLPTFPVIFNLVSNVLTDVIFTAYSLVFVVCIGKILLNIHYQYPDHQVKQVFIRSFLMWLVGYIFLQFALIGISSVSFIENFKWNFVYGLSIVWRNLVTSGCFVWLCYIDWNKKSPQVEYSLPTMDIAK